MTLWKFMAQKLHSVAAYGWRACRIMVRRSVPLLTALEPSLEKSV